ncbi:hypothetical protein [Acetivibrio cellulolyticus]
MTRDTDASTMDIELYKATSESQEEFIYESNLLEFDSNDSSRKIGLSSGTYYIKITNLTMKYSQYKFSVNK